MKRKRGIFIAFVKKEFWHLLRDSRTLLVALLIPVVLMILFGFTINTELNNVRVGFVIPHPSESIRQVTEKFSGNPYFTAVGQIPPARIDEILRRGVADAVIVFPEDFDRRLSAARQGLPAEPLAQLVMDASNPNTAIQGAAYLQGVILGDVAVSPEVRLLFNPQMKSAFYFVPGIMGMLFLIICAMLTSVAIVREKERGSMEVLLVSPVRPLVIIFAKMIPYFFLSCVNLATILLLSRYVLKVPLTAGIVSILGVSLLYIALSLAVGLFISTVTHRQVTALTISAMGLIMPSVMLSGMLFPIENLPRILQYLSCVIPARWFIDAMRKLMIEGLRFTLILDDFLILLGMTVALIALALLRFNDKID
ncbi:MAG: ABC transporter permease [Candidatus Cryptobacteroides sp.]|jgi:ABC-2 type transport system permease protein